MSDKVFTTCPTSFTSRTQRKKLCVFWGLKSNFPLTGEPARKTLLGNFSLTGRTGKNFELFLPYRENFELFLFLSLSFPFLSLSHLQEISIFSSSTRRSIFVIFQPFISFVGNFP